MPMLIFEEGTIINMNFALMDMAIRQSAAPCCFHSHHQAVIHVSVDITIIYKTPSFLHQSFFQTMADTRSPG